MLAEAKRWPERIWAIEGCQGIGRHLAGRLLADGEHVVDVPPKLAARTRVFATGQGRKTDATDAHSVALVGNAPIDASSGDQVRHRLSRAGNRQINRVLHIMAVVQLRNPTEGRDYYDRKVAAGKTPMEAMRALKRRLSDVVYRALLADSTSVQLGQAA
jgi:transposase